jgi:hypothetical protein
MYGVCVGVSCLHNIPESSNTLFHTHPPTQKHPKLRLEVLPNRDSLAYEPLYGLDPAETHTCFRGTLRYEVHKEERERETWDVRTYNPLSHHHSNHSFPSQQQKQQGWSELMLGCRALGLLSHAPLPTPDPAALLPTALNLPSSEPNAIAAAALARLRAEPGITDATRVLAAVRWLGLLGAGNDTSVAIGGTGNGDEEVIDGFSRVLERRLGYGPGERDMVAMRHDVAVDFPDAGVTERHMATLLAYGDGEGVAGGFTAMAKTVGWTSALAGGVLVVAGGMAVGRFAGVQVPLAREVYTPLLRGLAEVGVVFEEGCETVPLKAGKEGARGDGGRRRGREREQKAA